MYSEHAIGIATWLNSITEFRPEIRFERSYQREAYDNQTRRNQLTFDCDLTVHF